jgi:hypothetical protein
MDDFFDWAKAPHRTKINHFFLSDSVFMVAFVNFSRHIFT